MTSSKVMEAENAVKDGAQEFDYVLNVGKLKEHDYDYIQKEMTAMVEGTKIVRGELTGRA